jgi:hypothetical protein
MQGVGREREAVESKTKDWMGEPCFRRRRFVKSEKLS